MHYGVVFPQTEFGNDPSAIKDYAQTAEDNAFYDHPMGNLGDATVHTRSVLRPHGVFAVVSPFNFPMALAAGPTSGAMLAGNTVVLKPQEGSVAGTLVDLDANSVATMADLGATAGNTLTLGPLGKVE